MRIDDGVYTIAYVVRVKIDNIAHFAIHKTEIGKKLFLKKLSVFHNGFELRPQNFIDLIYAS